MREHLKGQNDPFFCIRNKVHTIKRSVAEIYGIYCVEQQTPLKFKEAKWVSIFYYFFCLHLR